MKKKLSAVLALALILSLTACSRQDIPTSIPFTEEESETAPLTDGDNTEAAEQTAEQTALNTEKTEETTDSETTSAAETTQAQTQTQTEAATAADPPVTSPAATEAPAPRWTETQVSPTTMYINTQGVYSRIEPIQGSAKVSALELNQAVTVCAKTDTAYFKTESGSYIHSSFLSGEKTAASTTTAATTTATVTAAATTAPPATEAPEEIIGPYNQRRQTQAEKDFADRVFDLTNAEREKVGLPKLKKMDEVTARANIRAWELTLNPAHQRPDGGKYYTVLNDMSYSASAENLAAGQATPEAVVEAWMNSDGHREHILSSDYEYLGIGYYDVEGSVYTHYWIQIFFAPMA